jgi:hypothetical protein
MARSENLIKCSFVCAACEGRTLRSVVVLQEVAEMQPEDASPCLLASRFLSPTVSNKLTTWNQCCGSGSGIRLFTSGSGIRDEQPGSYFLELRNNFLGLKYLNSLMRIRDGKNSDPGSGLEKVGSDIPRIRNTAWNYKKTWKFTCGPLPWSMDLCHAYESPAAEFHDTIWMVQVFL